MVIENLPKNQSSQVDTNSPLGWGLGGIAVIVVLGAGGGFLTKN